MKRQLTYLGFLIAYHILFWNEGIGINGIIFSASSLLFLRKAKPLGVDEWLYLLPYLASIVGLLSFHSVFSVVAMFLTFVTYAGYIANQQSSVLENGFNSVLSFFSLNTWHPALPEVPRAQRRRVPVFRKVTIAAVPVAIFVMFYALFVNGNPVFKEMHHASFAHFANWFEGVNITWVAFMVLGLFLVRWAILGKRHEIFALNSSNTLYRKKRRFEGKMLDLKLEYQIAVVLFAMLNILFAVANFIDVKWVWFQFYVADQFSLKEFVHHGVSYLIFITMISAAILLYFFRGNLNYYPANKRLVQLASLWTIQNIILTISVAIRTLHYIGFHGLAPLRLGVLIFTTVLFAALLALIFKINRLYSLAWVTRRTSAFTLLLLGVCAIVPWNRWTAIHNLNHPVANEVDVDYYLDLEPDAFPILYENLDVIQQQLTAHSSNTTRWVRNDYESFMAKLDDQTMRFLRQYEDSGWPSWTPSRHSAYLTLKQIMSVRAEETAALD
ncbi:MAG: DUF4173 domain-containing protein [Bacteroidetes bacterium]|nr:MAG: DUF4173 domain-containing protein [Bacteroidota bacterium]